MYENIRYGGDHSSSSSSSVGVGRTLDQLLPGEPQHHPRPQHLNSAPTVRVAKVKRNPSRLYRVVRPLTEVTPTPSPATKRCVGPEFVVMASEQQVRPVVLDLSSHCRKDTPVKKVNVIMLNGQKLVVLCSPHSITCGEVLDSVLSNQDIKEASYYSLALKSEDHEFWIMSSDTKLHKVAPLGWKESRQQHVRPVEAFDIYLRFKFLPDNVDSFKDPNNKHQLYLQLRTDILEGRYHMPVNTHISLAGMALQTEFGDFSEDIHGDGEYFFLDHYLPLHVINRVGEMEAKRSLHKLHRAHLGQSQSKTEIKFCREIQRLDNYGFHTFSVRETKKPTTLPKRHLGVHQKGLFLFETSRDRFTPHKIMASFFWHTITRIQYDKCRFQLSVTDASSASSETGMKKIKFYVSEVKSKLMFDLSSAHHQFHVQQRLNGSTESKDHPQVEYREPRETAIRSLKNRLLSKRQLSQRKLYTRTPTTTTSSLRRSTTMSAGSARLMVKRLTHYTSMADAMAKEEVMPNLDTSDKENCTPNIQNYR